MTYYSRGRRLGYLGYTPPKSGSTRRFVCDCGERFVTSHGFKAHRATCRHALAADREKRT